jgi:hypothetical protein
MNEEPRDTMLPEEKMVQHPLSISSLPFNNQPHENLYWTFCHEDQCIYHQNQKNDKNS